MSTKPEAPQALSVPNSSPLSVVSWSHSGRRLAAASSNGAVYVWDAPRTDKDARESAALPSGIIAKWQREMVESGGTLLPINSDEVQSLVQDIARAEGETEATITVDPKKHHARVAGVLLRLGCTVRWDQDWITDEEDLERSPGSITGVRFTAEESATPFILGQLADLDSLQTLFVNAAVLDLENLSVLEKLTSVRELTLSRATITEKAVEQLGRMPNLDRLVFEEPIINPDAANAAADLKPLERVSFSGLSVTDDSVQHLDGLKQLEQITFTGTRVSKQKAEWLRARLPDTQIVHDTFEADRQAAQWVLQVGGKVTILDDGKRIDATRAEELPLYPFRIIAIDLLEHPDTTDDDLTYLKELARLDVLSLNGKGITDVGLEQLSGLTALRSLRLNNTSVSGTGFTHLVGLTQLKYLAMGYTRMVTDEGIAALGKLTTLTTLALDVGSATDEGLPPLAQLKDLEYLYIGGGTLDGKGLTHLTELPRLRGLTLRYLQLSDDNLVHISKMKNLQRLILHQQNKLTDKSLNHLQTLQKLQELEIKNTQVSEVGIAFLRARLPHCKIDFEWDPILSVAAVKKTTSSGQNRDVGTVKLHLVKTFAVGDGEKTVVSVEFSPDARSLLTANHGGPVRLWDWDQEQPEVAGTFDESGRMQFARFAPDGETLICGGWSRRLSTWTVADHRLLWTSEVKPQAILDATFTPDGKKIIVGQGLSPDIEVLDAETGELIKTLAGSSYEFPMKNYSWPCVAVSADGKLIATVVGGTYRDDEGMKDAELTLWDAATFKALSRVPIHSRRVQDISFSHDGKSVATGGADRTTNIWSIAEFENVISEVRDIDGLIKDLADDAQAVRRQATGKLTRFGPQIVPRLHADAKSSNSSTFRLAVDQILKALVQRHPASGQLGPPTGSVHSVVFAPKLPVLATGRAYESAEQIRLWDVSDPGREFFAPNDENGAQCIAFSRDGKLMATGSANGTVSIWQVVETSPGPMTDDQPVEAPIPMPKRNTNVQ